MQKRTSDLRRGDVMMTGEVVQSANPGMYMGRKRMLVQLHNPKNGKVRVADWNLTGTVFLAKEQRHDRSLANQTGAEAHGASD